MVWLMDQRNAPCKHLFEHVTVLFVASFLPAGTSSIYVDLSNYQSTANTQ